MGLLSLAIWTPIAFGVVLLALGRDEQAKTVRWVALIALLLAAVATFFTAEPGKQFLAFGRDAWRETQKVVWPSRKEAIQMTGYVFAFVFVMALFLWLTDKMLETVLFDWVLGWKR